MRKVLLFGAILAVAASLGCLEDEPGPSPGAGPTLSAGVNATPCEHPWPCSDGSEWPPGLAGPFEVAGRERIEIETSDGVVLRGELVRPDVDPPTGLPTVLVLTPYMDLQMRDGQGTLDETFDAPVRALVEEGYAVATVAERGSWRSEGCWDWFTDRTTQDVLEVLQALAARPWSNGRVGMMGVSLPTTGVWEAIGAQADPLKAAATGGNIPDPFTWATTPQGLTVPAPTATAGTLVTTGTQAGLWPTPSPRTLDGQVRPCASGWVTDAGGRLAGDRSSVAQATTLPEIHDGRTAVLMLQGTRDSLAWSDEGLWSDYAGPKGQILGPWSHELPDADHVPTWPDPVIEWFDFWLKGLSAPDSLNRAQAVRDDETITAERWPPEDTDHRALYFGEDSLQAEPGTMENTMAAPASTGPRVGVYGLPDLPAHPLCQVDQPPYASTHWSPPLASEVTLAGDAWAYLDLEATTGHGGFVAHLYAVPENFSCQATRPQGAELVTAGGADLSYLDGAARPDPPGPGATLQLRVDLNSMATQLEAGQRLVLVLAAGDPRAEWSAHGQAGSAITVVGDGTRETSHVVLPVLQGSLGGSEPLDSYPPRPFSRAWFEEGGTIGGDARGAEPHSDAGRGKEDPSPTGTLG